MVSITGVSIARVRIVIIAIATATTAITTCTYTITRIRPIVAAIRAQARITTPRDRVIFTHGSIDRYQNNTGYYQKDSKAN
jgi:hypothetical protein